MLIKILLDFGEEKPWNVIKNPGLGFHHDHRIMHFIITECPNTESKYGVFSGPYFSAFGLNRERYGVNSVFGQFLRSGYFLYFFSISYLYLQLPTCSMPFSIYALYLSASALLLIYLFLCVFLVVNSNHN